VHVGKGKAKQGEICVILLFFTSLCCFVGIEMQKEEKQEEEKVPGGAGALACLIQSCAQLLSLNGKYTFLFLFLTVRAISASFQNCMKISDSGRGIFYCI
jgi:hypothetical protein